MKLYQLDSYFLNFPVNSPSSLKGGWLTGKVLLCETSSDGTMFPAVLLEIQ